MLVALPTLSIAWARSFLAHDLLKLALKSCNQFRCLFLIKPTTFFW